MHHIYFQITYISTETLEYQETYFNKVSMNRRFDFRRSGHYAVSMLDTEHPVTWHHIQNERSPQNLIFSR
jgi:hypothetical protein